MDQGPVMAFVEYATVRGQCPEHGSSSQPCPGPSTPPLHARVRAAGRLARMQVLKTATAELMRIDWASVGGICRRVYDELDAEAGDRFDGLVASASTRDLQEGPRYMTVVLDHDANRVVWCAKGHRGRPCSSPSSSSSARIRGASIRVVTADGARWIAELAESYCPNAERVMDPFHVVSWMTDVVDELSG